MWDCVCTEAISKNKVGQWVYHAASFRISAGAVCKKLHSANQPWHVCSAMCIFYPHPPHFHCRILNIPIQKYSRMRSYIFTPSIPFIPYRERVFHWTFVHLYNLRPYFSVYLQYTRTVLYCIHLCTFIKNVQYSRIQYSFCWYSNKMFIFALLGNI